MDANAPLFRVTCDASEHAIGAVLEQEGADGKMHVIEYFSAKFDDRISWKKDNTLIYMKELHSLGRACTRWRYYLHQRLFTVRTDNSTARSILERTLPLSGSRAKVWARLDGFIFNVEHIAGSKNIVADVLSR